ncbi:alpha-ketoglutarate-dependent dioxygenase alkB homolog 4 [Osmerus mordax]|uniref:alpha-ketoglutarate-dependent dioxygenase alkB homolog 4 n=1 Tax=Osmerus mordax TaxID=8014 RepID=UPI0035106BF5
MHTMSMDEEQATPGCGCKGIRSCLKCENVKGKTELNENGQTMYHDFIYDPILQLALRKDCEQVSFPFPGVFLWENFISEEDEIELAEKMDRNVWRESQSGRKKQDYGPKVNFKKHKVRVGGFCGLPDISQKLVQRMSQEPVLAGFQPVEQCNLDYSPQRGSAIDPHLDDSWLWGERLVTINLLSDTILTMSMEEGLSEIGDEGEVRVKVHLPRRSLVVLQGEARHRWKHAIYRQDVHARRVCSTYRELSAEFLPGGEQEELGAQLLNIACSFQGTSL